MDDLSGKVAELATSRPHALALEGMVLELVAEFTRPRVAEEAGIPRWLLRVRERLRDSVADPPGLDQLAAEAGVHPSHVSRTFRKHFGETLSDFTRRQRVDLACRLMTERPTEPLAAVANVAGFADASHMAREFRRWLGVSPTRFRGG